MLLIVFPLWLQENKNSNIIGQGIHLEIESISKERERERIWGIWMILKINLAELGHSFKRRGGKIMIDETIKR